MSTTDTGTARPVAVAQNLAPRRRSFGAWFADTGWRHVVAIVVSAFALFPLLYVCLLYTSPSPRDVEESRMPSSA